MNNSFSLAREVAFQELQKIDSTKILDATAKRKLSFLEEIDVWEVTSVVEGNSGIVEIVLHVVFPHDFPLSLPKIFLSPNDYENIKYVPHVDANRLICTYDEELTRPDPQNPSGVLIECISKAKQILTDGLKQKNHEDFKNEFFAYWQCKYGSKDSVKEDVLSLIDSVREDSELKLICLNKTLSSYNYILYQNDNISENFINYLNDYKIGFEIIDVFHLGELIFKMPPFSLQNRDVLKLISELSVEKQREFKKYIDKNNSLKLITGVVRANNDVHLIGWFHTFLNSNIKGFRPGHLPKYTLLKTLQSSTNVIRISPEIFTPKRLDERIGNKKGSSFRKLMIAGIGSIGSNLIYYLNSVSDIHFTLVDPDILKVENIKRHFLGFDYVGLYKSDAVQHYLRAKNPIQQVISEKNSIIKICQSNIELLNQMDFIFICIGKANISQWLGNAIKSGEIKKPLFFLWVEPYLAGGHCLIIYPNSKNYETYFDEDGFFKNNIIDKKDYIDKPNLFTLREAGCQTTFTPYNLSSVTSFLSAIFPKITNAFLNKSIESDSFTWIGDKEQIEKLGISLSDFGKKNFSETLVKHG